ncbi:hypothetical protein MMC17_002836 [Xylographa soralifera]|nr:hypothetical protein [Xylographa soralifera]
MWSPSHKLITGLDKHRPGVHLRLRNLFGDNVDVSSLLHSSCLNELCYQSVYDVRKGPGIRDMLDVVYSSTNLQILELRSRKYYREIGLEDFALRDVRTLPPLQEIRFTGQIFASQALCRLEGLIDWSRLRRLKVSPLKTYRIFLERSQHQLSNLQFLAVGHNGSEQLSIRNWTGDIGCLCDDDYAPPIYYSSLLHLNNLTELLLSKGAYVNAHGGRYEYPLQAAVYSGDLATVELLLNHGAQVNAKSRIMGNALQIAACRPNMAIIELLLDHGADFVSPGVMFDDVLQICIHQHNVDLTIKLITLGAPIQVQERSLFGYDIHLYGYPPNIKDYIDGSILSSASNAAVFDTAKGTRWSGSYFSLRHGKQFDTSFGIHTIPHVLLDGEVLISGTGEDRSRRFDIHGRTTPATGLISFVKIYESRLWMCSGQLQADGNTIIGRWGAKKGDCGIFKVVRLELSGSIGPLRDGLVSGIY